MFKKIAFSGFLAACGTYCHATQQPEVKQDVIEEESVEDYTLKHTQEQDKADARKSLKEGHGLVPQKKIVEQQVELMQDEADAKDDKVLPIDGVQQLAANEALFQQKLTGNKCAGGNWYKNNIPKDLAGIRKAYPRMQQRAHKQAGLEISHGLAALPDYAGDAFYVKVDYWSCKLYDLKKKVNPSAAKQLFCSLKIYLEEDIDTYCPYHEIGFGRNIPLLEPKSTLDNPNWQARFDYAQQGWMHYNAKSKDSDGLAWYKKWIHEEMAGLQKAYPKLQAQQHKKEALELFIALSEMHRFEHVAFLFQYLTIQHRLWELTGKVGYMVNNDIVYTKEVRALGRLSWTHGSK